MTKTALIMLFAGLTAVPAFAADTSPGAGIAGCVIEDIAPASAAETAGLKKGDVLFDVGGRPIERIADLQEVVGSAQADLVIRVRRKSRMETFIVRLPPEADRGYRLGVACEGAEGSDIAVSKTIAPRGPRLPQNMLFVTAGPTRPFTKVGFRGADRSESLGEIGPGVGLQYLHSDDQYNRWAIGLDVFYHHFSSAENSDLLNGTDTTFSFRSLTALVIGRWNFFRDARSQVYLLGGIGISSNRLTWEGTPREFYGWSNTGTRETRVLTDDSTTGFASALGLGFNHRVSGPWIAGFEARFSTTGQGTYKPTSAGQSIGVGDFEGNVASISALAHVGYRFGAPPPAPAPVPVPTPAPANPEKQSSPEVM